MYLDFNVEVIQVVKLCVATGCCKRVCFVYIDSRVCLISYAANKVINMLDYSRALFFFGDVTLDLVGSFWGITGDHRANCYNATMLKNDSK